MTSGSLIFIGGVEDKTVTRETRNLNLRRRDRAPGDEALPFLVCDTVVLYVELNECLRPRGRIAVSEQAGVVVRDFEAGVPRVYVALRADTRREVEAFYEAVLGVGG